MPEKTSIKNRLANARKAWAERGHTRDAIYPYLQIIYSLRNHKFDEIHTYFNQESEKNGVFSHAIATTSDCDPKLRSKYAKVLRKLNENKVKSSDFIEHIKNKGGLNNIIKKSK